MKWAPNKKLHFEVAIIKAIQSLGQATLDEVIKKLGELRDGGTRSVVPTSRDDAGLEESATRKTGITDPGYKPDAPRVEEKAAALDAEKIWKQVLATISPKSILRTLSDLVLPIGDEG